MKFKVITAESMEIPDFKVRSVCTSFNMNQLEKKLKHTKLQSLALKGRSYFVD